MPIPKAQYRVPKIAAKVNIGERHSRQPSTSSSRLRGSAPQPARTQWA